MILLFPRLLPVLLFSPGDINPRLTGELVACLMAGRGLIFDVDLVDRAVFPFRMKVGQTD